MKNNFKLILFLYIILLTLISVFTVSCQVNKTSETYPTDKSAKIKISDLPEDYGPETAKNNGDHVTIAGDGTYNDNVLVEFFDKITNKKEEAYIRTAHYTIAHYLPDSNAGIIRDCYYDTKYVHITIDYTRYFVPDEENRVIQSEKYKNLIKYYNEERKTTYYIATDLNEITDEIFSNGSYGNILTWQFDK